MLSIRIAAIRIEVLRLIFLMTFLQALRGYYKTNRRRGIDCAFTRPVPKSSWNLLCGYNTF